MFNKPPASLERIKNKFMMILLALGVTASAEGASKTLSSFEGYGQLKSLSQKQLVELKQKLAASGGTIHFNQGQHNVTIESKGEEIVVTEITIDGKTKTSNKITVADVDGDGIVDKIAIDNNMGGANHSHIEHTFTSKENDLAHTKVSSTIDLSKPIAPFVSEDQSGTYRDLSPDQMQTVQATMAFNKSQEKFVEGVEAANGLLSETAEK